ncbi:MAG: hypothetical protein NVS9B15_19650 [Acidobacteriaceae bacterium]
MLVKFATEFFAIDILASKLERRSSDMAIVAVYTYSERMDDKSAAAGIGATNGFAGHMDESNPNRDSMPPLAPQLSAQRLQLGLERVA